MTSQDNSKVLSTEEIDALLAVTGAGENGDLSVLVMPTAKDGATDVNVSANELKNVTEITMSETDNAFSSFLGKKIIVKSRSSQTDTAGAFLTEHANNTYGMFMLTFSNKQYYCLIGLSLPLLHQSCNLLFGGRISENDKVITTPGKIGLCLADELATLVVASVCKAFCEYEKVTFTKIKTVPQANLVAKPDFDVKMLGLNFSLYFNEIETTFSVLLEMSFLHEIIPEKALRQMGVKVPWRDIIGMQLAESDVAVNVVLPKAHIRASELMVLKEGDIIPIGDPTLVDVAVNNQVLFHGTAGQHNEKLAVQIVSHATERSS